MDRNHRCARPHQRQHKVWGVQKINPVLTENPRKLNLLPNRVVFQLGSNYFRSASPNLHHVLRARRENQQIVPLRLLCKDRLNQALHISADAEVLDSAEVESNLHGIGRFFQAVTVAAAGMELCTSFKSAATIISISCSKPTVGFQPSLCRTLVPSPHR